MARILFFGKLGDLAGARERNVALTKEPETVNGLIAAIGKDDSVLAAALQEISVRVIVNEEMASGDTPITDKDEIAFLPPVSGG
ncbi:MoaD/ThiS family protein [Hyphococcus sp.]|uniref:MoaD/ThiS family protein n=1 Tax=Hyphococcus sp. TaxID=2038636 RepID=UPI003CCC17AF